MLVRENIEFKRGQSVTKALNVGIREEIKEWALQNFDWRDIDDSSLVDTLIYAQAYTQHETKAREFLEEFLPIAELDKSKLIDLINTLGSYYKDLPEIREEYFKFFVKQGYKPKPSHFIQCSNAWVFKKLLQFKDFNISQSALDKKFSTAIAAGIDLQTVKMFLKRGADPTYDNNRPFARAADRGKEGYSIIDLLLKAVKKQGKY